MLKDNFGHLSGFFRKENIMEDFILIAVLVASGFVIVGLRALKEIKKNDRNKK